MLNARTRSSTTLAEPGPTRAALTPARPAAAAVAEPAPDRKRAILLAAERLFALHGYHAVSIRQIADQAGVPLALVGYHYGAKHELFHAIFSHWASTIDARLEALAAARSGPSRGRLVAIVRAFVEPVLRLRASEEGEFYALLVARELFHRTTETERALRDFFDPMAHAFIDALAEAVPGCTRPQMAWCYQFALGTLLHHLSDDRVERLSQGQAQRCDPAAADALVSFITAGIKAAASIAPNEPPTTTSATTPRTSRSSKPSPHNHRRPR